MLASGLLGEARGQRVILAAGRAGQNRRLQVAVVARDAEGGCQRRDHSGHNEEERNAGKRFAAPESERRASGLAVPSPSSRLLVFSATTARCQPLRLMRSAERAGCRRPARRDECCAAKNESPTS